VKVKTKGKDDTLMSKYALLTIDFYYLESDENTKRDRGPVRTPEGEV